MSKRSLDSAINEAYKAKGPYRLGAVMFRGSNVIISGYNMGVDHAEMRVLNRYSRKPRKRCDFLVIRVRNNGSFANSKPCLHCLRLLKANNYIDRVYYTTSEGEIIMEKLDDIESSYVTRGHTITY